MSAATARLKVRRLRVEYRTRGKQLSFNGESLAAVDDVSLDLDKGEAIGIVGESGSGKSSLARAITGIVVPTAGEIILDGVTLSTRRTLPQRRAIQMVFQDPSTALNPRMTVGDVLRQLLRTHRPVSVAAREGRVSELIELVGLPKRSIDSRPGELSGGQRQRASIARALAVEPNVLIADEATSALDVSVQASILRVIDELRRELDLAVIFISHDLAVVRQACARITVMRGGMTVEHGATERVLTDPEHDYTRVLVASVPELTAETSRG